MLFYRHNINHTGNLPWKQPERTNRWRKKYGNLELADAKRFKELEKEFTSASEKA